MRQIAFTVPPELDGILVKNFLRYQCGISARLLVKLKRQTDGLLLHGVRVRSVDVLHSGDEICITMTDDEKQAEPKCLPIKNVYEDEDVLIIDKPFHMPMYPTKGHDCDSLANAIAAYYQERQLKTAFRPIYRLDKDTSGLIVIAKNSYVAARLANSIKKVYIAVCEGFLSGEGTVDSPIQLLHGHTIQREAGKGGEKAVTHWQAVESSGSHTFLKLHLETGRTHQIRVHMSHIGHPLAGDDMYGGSLNDIERQALHCMKVSFMHPVTNQPIEVQSSLPEDILRLALKSGLKNCTNHNSNK